MTTPLASLRRVHPWPTARPDLPEHWHGWSDGPAHDLLAALVAAAPAEAPVVVELGVWLGLTTRYLAERFPTAHILAVDHWLGSEEHYACADWRDLLPRLYDQAAANLWPWRDRITLVRRTTLAGLVEIHAAGLRPAVVWIDAAHDTAAVAADLATALALFPAAAIAGHDWQWESVQTAVRSVARSYGLSIRYNLTSWRLTPPDA